MQHLFSAHAGGRTGTRRQAYVLLLLGFVFLIVAWLGLFNSYSVGVLLFGLGMLGAAPLNPRRFLSAGWLTTMLGVATFLMFRQYIFPFALSLWLPGFGLFVLGLFSLVTSGRTEAQSLN